MRYTSAFLFHGPGARVEALSRLPEIGRRLSDPVGDEGLKVGDAREVIALLTDAPLGDEPGVVLIGPLDRAAQNATDVLLKIIEEFNTEVARPVLWAYDLGGVSAPIKSRCILHWCPNAPPDEDDGELVKLAFSLVEASLALDRARVIEILQEAKGDDNHAVLEACVQALATEPERMSGGRYGLWVRLRRLLSYQFIGKTEILAAFVAGGAL